MKQEKLMTKKISFKNLITKQENSEIGKKVLTDRLDLKLVNESQLRELQMISLPAVA